MRKSGVLERISTHVGRLLQAAEVRLDVQQVAVPTLPFRVRLWILDDCVGAVRALHSRFAALRHVEVLEPDANAKIYRRLAHDSAQVGIDVVRITSRVADYDEAAAPP